MPRPVLGAALERLGPILVQIYGQSEAPMTITCLQAEDHLGDGEQRFSAGRPWRSVAVEVRGPGGEALPPGEKGEVAVSGSHLMTRYHGLPDATADVLRDGWVMTRDVGAFDERGFLYLLGRTDEMIISGGYNIAPREVEQVLSAFPGAEEVSVLGVPDDRWGTAVAAVVKLHADASAREEDVIEFAKPRLGFRSPKVVRIVDAIPRNAYGKVDRRRVLSVLEERVPL
jgi:acyl-CoA synthetase (AMP-forming)/AMP-acid ligase II